MVADCTSDIKASVAELDVELVFQPLTSNAPSTDPRPVARLYVAPSALNPSTPGTVLLPDGVG
jgi:hypothetical protein